MTTPEELLCSRKWRMARSLWMLFGWFPFAFAAWIGYLIIGVKSRNWKWITLAIAFFVFGVTAFWVMVWVGNSADVDKGQSFPEPYATYSSIVMWTTLLVWIGNAAVLQWFINRRWLIWRAHNGKKVSAPWYATATATGQRTPQPDAQRVASVFDATLANGSGTTALSGTQPAAPAYPSPPAYPPPPAPGAYPAPVGYPAPAGHAAPPTPPPAARATPVVASTAAAAPVALDINSATQAELMTLPGFDAGTAAQVVSARQQGGVFSDVSELVTRAGVKPHVVAGLSGKVAVVPAPAASPRAPGSPNGRRLEF